jgi:hypothetical protein
MKNKRVPWLLILFLYLVWNLLLFLVNCLAQQWLPYTPSFPYTKELLKATNFPQWLYSRANFDGVHYLTIARDGYRAAELIQAFFPVYPLLMRGLGFLLGSKSSSYLISGVIISNLSLLGVLLIAYKLAVKLFNHKTAINVLLVLLLFPTSFYFGVVYSESLFLLLILLSAWYWEQEKNTISSILSGLSSGVRLVGASLGFGYFLELVAQSQLFKKTDENWQNKLQNFYLANKRKLFSLLLSFSGLLAFIFFLHLEFNDPLYFFNVQSAFGAGRQTEIILLPRVFYRSIKILLTARPFNWKYFTYTQDFVLSAAVGIGMIEAWKHKKIRPAYVLFALVAYLLPTLTGNLSSMPRYVLVLWPVHLWWADYISQKPKLRLAYFVISSILLIINFSLFVQGHWVA